MRVPREDERLIIQRGVKAEYRRTRIAHIDTYHAPWKPRPATRAESAECIEWAAAERGGTAVVGKLRAGKDWPLSSVDWMTQADESGGAETGEAGIEVGQRGLEAGAECAQHWEPIEVRSRREEHRQYSGAADGSGDVRVRRDQGEDDGAATGTERLDLGRR